MTTTTTLLTRAEFIDLLQRRWQLSPETWAELGLDVQPCDCGGLPWCEGWMVVALARQRQDAGLAQVDIIPTCAS